MSMELNAPSRRCTVLVTGANGFIGSAICRAFVRAGWRTFGFVRRPEAAKDLVAAEAIPVLGTFQDLSFLDALYKQSGTFDAIVSCTEQIPGYAAHFEQVMALVKALADTSSRNGVRSLVLWSSGCKDYGCTGLHGTPGLAAHTEQSPLNGPELLQQRVESCLKIFDHADAFDAVLLRPTSVFGYSGSYYGPMMSYVAGEASTGAKVLKIPADPRSIMHATHVDDCAAAYLLLAEHRNRSEVAGQAFNISGHRYETTGEVGAALADEYGFAGGVEFVPAGEAGPAFGGLQLVFSFSQWVDSDRIRKLTGWEDRRLLFSENVSLYRKAFEAAEMEGNDNVAAIKSRMNSGFEIDKA